MIYKYVDKIWSKYILVFQHLCGSSQRSGKRACKASYMFWKFHARNFAYTQSLWFYKFIPILLHSYVFYQYIPVFSSSVKSIAGTKEQHASLLPVHFLFKLSCHLYSSSTDTSFFSRSRCQGWKQQSVKQVHFYYALILVVFLMKAHY